MEAAFLEAAIFLTETISRTSSLTPSLEPPTWHASQPEHQNNDPTELEFINGVSELLQVSLPGCI